MVSVLSARILISLSAIFLAFVAMLHAADCLQGPEVEKAQKAFNCGDYKEAITVYEKMLKTAPKDCAGLIKEKIAISYYHDQDQEKAFRIYLEALDNAKIESSPKITEEEQTFYEEALKIYLDHSKGSSHESANKIRQEYASVYAVHPDYYLLAYILAAAYANLEMFDDFFDTFYHSYRYWPDHYMAFKTKAVLHIKLFERARSAAERNIERQKIIDNVLQAIERNSRDESLYKLMVAYSNDREKPKVLDIYLNKIIDENIVIPRTDIAFYVQQAVAVKQNELAQRFINKANEWYQFSRVINAAQDYLNQNTRSR